MPDYDVSIVLDLPHFGELVAAIVRRQAEINGTEPPDDVDEWREIVKYAWTYCMFMADRLQMAQTSLDDLDALPVYKPEAQAGPPSPFDAPLDTRRLSDRERAARRPKP